MREALLTFPFILPALATIAVLGPSIRNVVIVLGITGWPIYTRVVRAETVRLRSLEFTNGGAGVGRHPRGEGCSGISARSCS